MEFLIPIFFKKKHGRSRRWNTAKLHLLTALIEVAPKGKVSEEKCYIHYYLFLFWGLKARPTAEDHWLCALYNHLEVK